MAKVKMEASAMKEVQREFKEAGEAIDALEGEIATIRVDPNDPRSLERALQEMKQAVDQKIVRYRENRLVRTIAEKARMVFEEQLREKARK